ncbi:hypothetical protein JK364_54380, partial [Streptomyces sp. 110]|nr:hypothetical protein [Streptomyces endocoffeicus]
LHDLVGDHTRRLAATAPEESAADRAAVLHLYTAAGRITSDWGPEGFPTGPDVSGSPLPRWLDAAGDKLVDVAASAAGEHDLACWIAESMVDHLVPAGSRAEVAPRDAGAVHVYDGIR